MSGVCLSLHPVLRVVGARMVSACGTRYSAGVTRDKQHRGKRCVSEIPANPNSGYRGLASKSLSWYLAAGSIILAKKTVNRAHGVPDRRMIFGLRWLLGRLHGGQEGGRPGQRPPHFTRAL